MTQADHILACRTRWLAKLAASGRLDFPRGNPKRGHKKRHSVNRERSYLARLKAATTKTKQAAALIERRRRNAIMAAYFRGDVPDLSGLSR